MSLDPAPTGRLDFEPTGVPLLDAIAAALLAAYEQGKASGRGDRPAVAAAHEKTLVAVGEVQRLWRQLDIEVNGARRAPEATAAGR